MIAGTAATIATADRASDLTNGILLMLEGAGLLGTVLRHEQSTLRLSGAATLATARTLIETETESVANDRPFTFCRNEHWRRSRL